MQARPSAALARVARPSSHASWVLVRASSASSFGATRHSSSAPLAHPTNTTFREPSFPGYGQPLPSTHPHLLAPGELTPGISAEEYALRRTKLMENLEDGATVIIAGGRLKYASGKIFYKFRQESNFWYLTGWEEPDSVLVLQKDRSPRGYSMTMFIRFKDAHDEVWNGPRSGREGATEVFGADEAIDIASLAPRLRKMLDSSSAPIYIDFEGVPSSTRRQGRQQKRSLLEYLVPSGRPLDEAEQVAELLSNTKRTTKSAATVLEDLRLIKSDAEIRVLRRAADISAKAHAKVMRFCESTDASNKTEASLVAHFEYITALEGAARPAYVPVCAAGSSSLTIHYISNRLPLHSGEIVALDAGCEYGGYASDITRTFPISGKFSSAQRDLYEAVLRVQKACIELCTARAGYSMEQLHRKSVEVMRTELRDLGFTMRGGDLERTLYPHFLTHPIGIDLHDTPGFSRGSPLQAGMIVTVEPGIFVPPSGNFPKHFHNMSVRVEDEVLVGDENPVILSVNAPKEVVDIEACCQGLLDGVR